MDIEQLRKINEMSKTLQKHGLATGSEDGAKMAGDLQDQHLPESHAQAASSGEVISREMVEILIEREARKLRHKVEALEEEIAQLKARPVHIPAQSSIEIPRQAAQNQAPSAPAQQAQAPATQTTHSSNSGTPDNSIKGRNPDEFDDSISVEKMFYYGSK